MVTYCIYYEEVKGKVVSECSSDFSYILNELKNLINNIRNYRKIEYGVKK